MNAVAITPYKGRMLATGGEDRKIAIWAIGKTQPILVCTMQCGVIMDTMYLLMHRGLKAIPHLLNLLPSAYQNSTLLQALNLVQLKYLIWKITKVNQKWYLCINNLWI